MQKDIIDNVPSYLAVTSREKELIAQWMSCQYRTDVMRVFKKARLLPEGVKAGKIKDEMLRQIIRDIEKRGHRAKVSPARIRVSPWILVLATAALSV